MQICSKLTPDLAAIRFSVEIGLQINTGINDGYLSGWYVNCFVRLTPAADKHHELFG